MLRGISTPLFKKKRAKTSAATSIVGLDSVLPSPRPLSDDESQLVRFLADHSTNKQLATQVELLTVYRKCTCGCPTIGFAFNGVPVSAKGERIISDYMGVVDGDEVGVMLFEQGGYLSTLEVYSCAGTTKPFGLPPIETLRPA